MQKFKEELSSHQSVSTLRIVTIDCMPGKTSIYHTLAMAFVELSKHIFVEIAPTTNHAGASASGMHQSSSKADVLIVQDVWYYKMHGTIDDGDTMRTSEGLPLGSLVGRALHSTKLNLVLTGLKSRL